MEAMRALKRRLSDVVFRQMTADARCHEAIPFSRSLPLPLLLAGPQPLSSGLCLTAARTGAHSPGGNNQLPLTQRGARRVRTGC
jgi:hypothetical protein